MKKILKYLILFILLVNVSCEELDNEPAGEFNGFECNKPSYSSMPEHDSKDGDYRFYTYSWQDNPQICINTYEGVSQESKTLITEVINDGKTELGLLVPVNVYAFNNGLSDLDQVVKDWGSLKLASNLDFHDYVAAAGVDHFNIHNGGIIELAHGIYEMADGENYGSYARKIIYHEFFHVHQNSHRFYFENQKNFGFNLKREENFEMFFPVWLEEGGADFAAIYLSSKRGWVDFKYAMTESLDEARNVIIDASTRNDIVSLRDYETSDGIRLVESENNPSGVSRIFAYQYSAGAWAFAYLWHLNDNNLDGALVNYYKNIAEIEKDNVEKGWKLAFQETFGINIEQFYSDFDNFMLLPREDQIAILKY
tara:strand:- start:169 stop:1269 length:1101 start_codon:yes stop_codon:yes gene_type:complete